MKIYWAAILLTLLSFKQHTYELVVNENSIVNYKTLKPFFRNLDSLACLKDNVVSIVHIGDSHIQADFLTSSTRCLFQEKFGNAGRGFVFPYRIVHTGGALDVRFDYSGQWHYCEIMRSYKDCNIGVAGYSITAGDSALVNVDVASKAISDADFNHVSLLSSRGNFYPTKYTGNCSFHNVNDRTEIYFSELQDSLSLIAIGEGDYGTKLQGMILKNGNAGVLYHSMGVNGSSTLQYLRSNGFEKELAELNANLIIISFGTNDCYLPSSRFCVSCVKERFTNLIMRIKVANPNVPILLTTPPDHFYFKKQSNQNIEDLRLALHEICLEQDVALWDLYHIMGGANSILTWRNEGLARNDLIHFTKEGYQLQGELLYNAIMKHYEQREM
ncbi:MAG: hypothetical protein RLZZ337_1078 [Bacteroidota bacterium]